MNFKSLGLKTLPFRRTCADGLQNASFERIRNQDYYDYLNQFFRIIIKRLFQKINQKEVFQVVRIILVCISFVGSGRLANFFYFEL